MTELFESLLCVLQHQLVACHGADADIKELVITASLIEKHQNSASFELQQKLQDILVTNMQQRIEQHHSSLSAVCCLHLCSMETMKQIINSVLKSELNMEAKLELFLSLRFSVDNEESADVLSKYTISNLAGILELDSIGLVKKVGVLLQRLLPLASADVCVHLEQALLFHYHPFLSASCTILCSVTQCLVAKQRMPHQFKEILVQGVQSEELQARKQCIYILRTLLDALDKCLLTDWSFFGVTESRKDEVLLVWSDYLLLLESLNEKQYHIVQPNLARLDSILPAVSQGDLNIAWVFALLRRLLNHDNMQIKRFAALYVLRLDYSLYPEFLTKDSLPVLCREFISMACQSPFFTRRPDQGDDVIREMFAAMRSYLHNVVSAITDFESKAHFLHGVLSTLVNAPWCPVPCMYWVGALASLNDLELKGCWGEETLAIILEVMADNFILCDRRIRQATCSYLLTAILTLCPINQTTSPSLYNVILSLRRQQILKYGSKQWSKLSSAFNTATLAGHMDQEAALLSSCREDLAVMLLSTDELTQWLKLTCEDILCTCSVRPYVNREKVMQALHMLVYIHQLVSGSNDSLSAWIVSLLERAADSISGYVLRLIGQKEAPSADELQLFVDLLKLESDMSGCRIAVKLCEQTVKEGNVQHEQDWELLGVVFSMEYSHKDMTTLINKLILAVMEMPWSRHASVAETVTRWRAHYRYLQMTSPDVDWQHWYSEAMDAFSVLYREDSCVVFNCLAVILPHVDVEHVEATAQSLLSKVEEESKNSHYIPLISSLSSCLFTERLSSRVECGDVLLKTFTKLYTLAEERPGVANAMARQLARVATAEAGKEVPDWLLSACIKLAVYGPIHNKAHRTVTDAFLFLEATGELEGIHGANQQMVGYDVSDTEVRVLAVDSLVHLVYSSHQDAVFSLKVLQEVADMYRELLTVKCYNNFPNSLSHRQRHRLLSLLLVLLPQCIQFEETCTSLLDFLLSAIKAEMQPSCRRQLEWMYIYTVTSHPHLITSRVVQLMDYKLLMMEKTTYVCSLFCIAAHICTHGTDRQLQLKVMRDVVLFITPWGMSSKFHVRIHAQAALLRIWQHAVDRSLANELSAQLPLFRSNMDFALHSGTATEKNSRKLLENFFYFKFDAIKDWSLETIFSLWPRLLILADGESMDPRLFSENTQAMVPVYCHHGELRTCDPGSWHVKVKEGDSETESTISTVQRKVITWRTTNPAEDPSTSTEVSRADGLILVTSLIDKLPNLGGLCRTAEIFGATEMVVSSLKITEDANFLSTSVTAHQWLPLKQVPVHGLAEYLMEMKLYGYTVVGVEQATNSKCLSQYQMPVKTLLLLGNEKQGIPAELIQLVDVCVEIPQQGVIRSLNVHVSGALLIWEYRKQQFLATTS